MLRPPRALAALLVLGALAAGCSTAEEDQAFCQAVELVVELKRERPSTTARVAPVAETAPPAVADEAAALVAALDRVQAAKESSLEEGRAALAEVRGDDAVLAADEAVAGAVAERCGERTSLLDVVGRSLDARGPAADDVNGPAISAYLDREHPGDEWRAAIREILVFGTAQPPRVEAVVESRGADVVVERLRLVCEALGGFLDQAPGGELHAIVVTAVANDAVAGRDPAGDACETG